MTDPTSKDTTNNQVQVAMILTSGALLAYLYGAEAATAAVLMALALRPTRKN